MIVSTLFNEFIVFSFMGWIYECLFCTIVDKRWDNRGFLFGPVCPIYGVGAVTALTIFYRIAGAFNVDFQHTGIAYVFLICMFGTAVIEYTTSYVLEKVFHAVWWDYSNAPLNINGRVCLPASLAFGVAGVIIVRYFFPVVLMAENKLGKYPVMTELVSLIFMAVFAADLVLTVQSLTDLLSKVEAAEKEFNIRLEGTVEKVGDTVEKVGDTVGNAVGKVSGTVGLTAEKAKEYASKLNYRERYLLKNVKFKMPGAAKTAARIKEYTPTNIFRRITADDKDKENETKG